jgi:hypothetical protein
MILHILLVNVKTVSSKKGSFKGPSSASNQSNLCGMDLLFGLPPTAEGYTGIVVITEYVTKFPYAAPIKSKCSAGIAEKLFEYVSLFGPPNSWVSG